jgi:hypothetical protein
MTWGAVPWGGVGGDFVDGVAPVINNFDPAEDVAIGRTDPVAFDITDNTGQFAANVILARFLEEGSCECVFNGLNFESRYAAGSSRVGIANGNRFTVRRTGGWLSTPIQLVVLAIDAAGNVTRREIGFG